MFRSMGSSGYKQLTNLFAVFWMSRILIRKKRFKICQPEQFVHRSFKEWAEVSHPANTHNKFWENPERGLNT